MSDRRTLDFSSLLDDLIARADAEPPIAPARRVDLLNAIAESPVFAQSDIEAERRYLQSAEREEIEDRAVEALEQITVLAPPSIDPHDIARELALDATDADLDRTRRDFAFANHPDRVDAALRERAMIRMQIANGLIDEAKRRAR